MRRSGARHFERFDEELQDSDQTISTRAGRLVPRVRLPTVRDSRERRRFPPSAFFSDTTDDDASYPRPAPSGRSQLSMSAYSRPKGTERSAAPLHMSAGPRDARKEHVPRLHVDAIQFPVTRSVLWDRRPLSEPIGVSFGQVLPRFVVTADAMKEIYKLYQGGEARNGAVLGYLCGSVSLRGKLVKLENVVLTKDEARGASWSIPVIAVSKGSQSGQSQENFYTSAIAAVQTSYRDEYTDNVASRLRPKLLVSQTSPHTAQLDFQLECVASPVLLKFSLVRNLPLLMTPLAASLARCELSSQSDTLRCGYLTLDRTRKAVPLLKVDPLVLQQPIVGIWVYGVPIDDDWDEEKAKRQLADPFLYFSCIGYLMSEVIKQRVGPAKNTFLVAMYPAGDFETGSAVGCLPRFFECSFPDYLSPPGTPLPMELYSHRRSCLVGISKFSSDVEFTLTAAPSSEWEAARKQAKIPAAPAPYSDNNSDHSQHSIDEKADCKSSKSVEDARSHAGSVSSEESLSGWTVTPEVVPKDIADPSDASQSSVDQENTSEGGNTGANFQPEGNLRVSSGFRQEKDHSTAKAAKTTEHRYSSDESEESRRHRREHSDDRSYRSCCKTQQLLTIQHQQILENQQRQLHEMQEQIVQLKLLLEAARGKKSTSVHAEPNDEAYESDASSSSIGAVADVSGTFSRHGHSIISSQSSRASASPERSRNFTPASSNKRLASPQQASLNEETGVNNEADADKSASLSSLSLSSISSGSVDADLSSLSSSLTGERLKRSGSGPPPLEQSLDGDSTKALSISQLSKTSSNEIVKSPTDVDNTNSGEKGEIDQEQDDNVSDKEETASHTDPLLAEANTDSVSIVTPAGRGNNDDDSETSDNDRSVVERLMSPDTYLRKVGGFVDHHGGCFTTPPLDFHSFCVPRIKFATESPGCSISDSEDEEVRLIEQKYKRLMAA